MSHSASDLVMKVDALLTAAPKGEVRRDVSFIKDSHRLETFFLFIVPLTLYLFVKKHLNYLKKKGLYNIVLLNLILSVLSLAPRENEVFYDVVAIVDPLTREAQKMSSLLIVSCFLSSCP